MAKTLVFEGCPACERRMSGLDGLDFGAVVPYFTKTLTGGAIGAGGVIVADMVLPKILPAMTPLMRTLITGAAVVGGAYMLRDKYPDMAQGLAMGGGSIVVYKLINVLLGKVIATSPTPLSGLGSDMGDIELVEEAEGLGVLIPEELGQEEVFID